MLVTAGGWPLAVAITGANRQDSMLVEPILDGVAPAGAEVRSALGAGLVGWHNNQHWVAHVCRGP